ncbi:hypothetical protein PHYBOEH_011959 [Phytophthora boehmeriae]|uniref:Uncharacterized protein n=1 Tax=Phytophthora boehmeriae TaxID=109152 RepID=A0A8T1VDL2_9STRA|nr:hypothetical protein PHYBOEH_011959 [Phytophthora boehmeriae]
MRRLDATRSGATKRLHGSPPAANSGLVKPRLKKRRVQVEIPLFRQQVEQLELQLSRLEVQKTLQLKFPRKRTKNRQIPQCKAGVSSVWGGIAERQFKERLRAELEQKTLKSAESELVALSLELQKLLQKSQELTDWAQPPNSVGSQLLRRFWDFSVDDEIFTEQLVAVASCTWSYGNNNRDKCRFKVRTGRYTTAATCRWDERWSSRIFSAGIVFETHSGTTVPFNMNVVAKAYWKLFNYSVEDGLAIDESVDCSTDVIARSFAIRTNLKDFTAHSSGKYTYRKYMDEARSRWW